MSNQTSTELLLDAQNISVHYGQVRAVDDVSINIRPSQIVTVIGVNGAGKSSLMNAIMGNLPTNGRSTGKVNYLGHDVSALDVERRVARGLSLVPETRELFSSMTVEDNLILGAFRFRSDKEGERQYKLKDIYELFPRLKERRTQYAGTLSGGERQMLALGRALMTNPSLLLLDEPSLGLAPLVVREIFQIIQYLREEGASILLVEQNARAALQIADYAYVLEMGRLNLSGSASELLNHPGVIESYLGLGSGNKERV